VPTQKKMSPLTVVRDIVGAVLDQRKGSLGQGGKARCAAACRPRAGQMNDSLADGGCGGSTERCGTHRR
jgi:hypothetical protein